MVNELKKYLIDLIKNLEIVLRKTRKIGRIV